MILYHGSYVEVIKPDLLHSRENLDFGKGFYTTPLHEQAEKWCQKFLHDNKNGIISEYNFDEKVLNTKLKILKFEEYSEEWLDFIVKSRSGSEVLDYDLISGGIANDKVFNTIELFFDGLIDKYEVIKRLKWEKPNIQIAFKTKPSLKCLKYKGSIKL